MPDLSQAIQQSETPPIVPEEQVVTMVIPDPGTSNEGVIPSQNVSTVGSIAINDGTVVIPTTNATERSVIVPAPVEVPTIKKEEVKTVDLGGRPCTYCGHKEQYQKIADEYLTLHAESDKPLIPFLEELAMKMKIHRETLLEWSKNPELHNGNHAQFSDTIKGVLNVQRLRLLKRTLGRFNPTGAIFQLKANHGLIETEKRQIVGDREGDPLQVEIIEEKHEE